MKNEFPIFLILNSATNAIKGNYLIDENKNNIVDESGNRIIWRE